MKLFLKSLRVGAIVAVIVGLGIDAANGQAPGSDSSRTSWGDPDLQGAFTNKTITPFERPAALAGKEFLTGEEAAELEQERAVENAARDGQVPADIVGGAQLDDGYTHRRTPSRSLVEVGYATGETPAG